MKGKLVLETGDVFEGDILVDGGIKAGIVIFDTRVVGYEKVLTSPEYSGKIVCFTYPLIGNYGINYEDIETDTVYPSGLIISEYSQIYSNFRAKCSMEEFLRDKGITIIEGIDTQCITEIVRENKGIKGVIAPYDTDEKEIQRKIKEETKPVIIPDESFKEFENILEKGSPYIAVVNRIRKSESVLLSSIGMPLVFLNTFSPSIKELLSGAKFIYISSFEDKTFINRTAEVIKEFIGSVPVFGVGAGHLAVAVAMGGHISEEPLNHYGVNHPVLDMENGKKYITEQAHTLVVKKDSLKGKTRFINITDGSVEGLADRNNRVFSVAFYPGRDILEEFLSFTKGE